MEDRLENKSNIILAGDTGRRLALDFMSIVRPEPYPQPLDDGIDSSV